MKNLASLSTSELQNFFKSFDYVLSDVDGVLWNLTETIPGACEAIKFLKSIGKKVILVSNNTSKSLEVYHKQITRAGFEVTKDNIVTPILTTVNFLQKQDLHDKQIFVIGMKPLRRELEKAGFTLAENAPDRIPESSKAFTSTPVADDSKVGAVLVDFDINLNFMNLQRAATILGRPEVLFVKGPTDRHLTLDGRNLFVGPGYFTEILEDSKQRQGVNMAKPGLYLSQYVKEKFGIVDPKKVLFIGDSIASDMVFATECEYQKLLVLSGLTKKAELAQWKFEENYKPDFYAESLNTVYECIQRCFSTKL